MSERLKEFRQAIKARRANLIALAIKALIWLGAGMTYFLVFSLLFDTPAEYELRHSTDQLQRQYDLLESRYDTLEMVVKNLNERDRNIFAIMFGSEPYNLSADYESHRTELHEQVLSKSDRRNRKDLSERISNIEKVMGKLEKSYSRLNASLAAIGSARSSIPSIQPVVNNNLSLLTAGYGMLMHPFYKTLHSHQGVDYSVPEGSRVFATADGVVKDISGKNSVTGLTVVIDHKNGYTTTYSHLQQAKVKTGETVKRSDIIALSGNSGLSLAPHLHYEVRFEGVRVDPVYYFFMELTPDEYQKIYRIAQSGMQSFD